MDELWREGRRGGRKSDGGRGRKEETKREREFEIYFWDSSARGMKIAELRQAIGKNEVGYKLGGIGQEEQTVGGLRI